MIASCGVACAPLVRFARSRFMISFLAASLAVTNFALVLATAGQVSSASEAKAQSFDPASIDKMCRSLATLVKSAQRELSELERTSGASPSAAQLELIRAFDRQLAGLREQISELRMLMERLSPGADHACK